MATYKEQLAGLLANPVLRPEAGGNLPMVGFSRQLAAFVRWFRERDFLALRIKLEAEGWDFDRNRGGSVPEDEIPVVHPDPVCVACGAPRLPKRLRCLPCTEIEEDRLREVSNERKVRERRARREGGVAA